jgi:hypothetical protein
MLKNRLVSRRNLAAAFLLLPVVLLAQEPPAPPTTPPANGQANGRTGQTPAPRPPAAGPKKYEDVITAKAKTKDGLFKVHQIEEKFYYEIPENLYGRDMLMYNEIAQAPPGVGYSGSPGNNRMVRWSRRGNKVLLRINPVTKRATNGDAATQLAVSLSNFQPIIRSFNVEAEGKNQSVVIDVTPMFSSDIPELSAVSLLSNLRLPTAPPVDASRSFIDEIKSFPENIEVRSTLTWNLGGPPLPPTNPNAPRPAQIPGNLRSLSVMVHYSMVLLPEKPMMGRMFDPRVGYFVQPFEEYANEENRVEQKGYITRFRLEKKDPSAAVSEPVKPIIFYVSREVPDVWKPFIRKGIEDWNVAFEQAGFKNAIIARDAPSKEQDPDWDAEDVRYSVVRWAALPVENAMGPHVHDPRSGEIISAHLILWHDVLKLAQGWYFGMCSAQNDAARMLPFDKKLMGEILLYIASHEVGHTIGLRHNHKASSAYSIAQLRDREFTKTHGSVGSIMAYGRFNYVAQPEDGVTALIPIIADYDKFAIEWGYKPSAGAKDPHDEKKMLDEIAARQMTQPFLRFGGEDGPAQIDPTVKTENIGDDPVQATTLGYKNLDRVINGWLVKATTKPGEDFDLLEETFADVWNLRRLWLGSVIRMVGGVVESRTLAGRGGDQFARVPKAKQKEAVKFLQEQVFMPPTNIIKPELLNQFQYFGAADLIINQQKTALETLLSPMRFKLLTDGEAMDAKTAYTLREFFVDVQGGLFSEASKPGASIDVYRRALQRNYLEHIKTLLNRPAAPAAAAGGRGGAAASMATSSWQQTDFRATARTMLEQLSQRLAAASATAKDATTASHLKDCRKEIEMILDPKKG